MIRQRQRIAQVFAGIRFMRSRIPAGLLRAALVLCLAQPSMVRAQQPITVGENIQVSLAHAGRAHFETQLAADPGRAGRLLGCAMVFSAEQNAYKTIGYLSEDGGRSWTPTLEADRGLSLYDPTCAFGPEGTAYFAAFGWRGHPGGAYEMLFYRSEDGGRTWAEPVLLPVLDREYVTVDATDGPSRGRIYVHGTGWTRTTDGNVVQALTLLHSTDDGASFPPGVKLPVMDGRIPWVGNGAVLSDGMLVVLFGLWDADAQTQPSRDLKIATSMGGERFGRIVTVADWHWPSENDWRLSSLPSLAADASDGPFKDRLYAVWPDTRSGRSEILLSYSGDRGATWSAPVVVNDDPAPAEGGADLFMPVVTVNRGGVVGVMWYDRRGQADGNGWHVRFSASTDGGATFLPAVRVSSHPYTLEGNRRIPLFARTLGGGSPWEDAPTEDPLRAELGVDRFFFNGGDTAGMAADAAGTFHPFWIDNRTGVPQIWTAAVSVSGRAERREPALPRAPGAAEPEKGAAEPEKGAAEPEKGAAEPEQGATPTEKAATLPGPTDVTSRVTLEFTNTSFDPTRGEVTTEVRLRNTSNELIAAPLEVRVLSVASPLGAVEPPGAEARVWNFSDLVPDGRLAPGQRSAALRLVFRISDPRMPMHDVRSWAISPALNVEARVFGRTGS